MTNQYSHRSGLGPRSSLGMAWDKAANNNCSLHRPGTFLGDCLACRYAWMSVTEWEWKHVIYSQAPEPAGRQQQGHYGQALALALCSPEGPGLEAEKLLQMCRWRYWCECVGQECVRLKRWKKHRACAEFKTVQVQFSMAKWLEENKEIKHRGDLNVVKEWDWISFLQKPKTNPNAFITLFLSNSCMSVHPRFR